MPEVLQSPSQQNLGASNYPLAAELIDSDLLQCSICKERYDCESRDRVPHVLPTCGHTFCAGCIFRFATGAQMENRDSFACPVCNHRQPIDGPCPTNWVIKSHVDGLRKIKRKRAAAKDDDHFNCPRHSTSKAEVLCMHCAELNCMHCAFECAQQQHKCVKVDAMQVCASGKSSSAIDAAFELGDRKIQARMDEEILKIQAAAENLRQKLEALKDSTKSAEEEAVKRKIQQSLSRKDARGLCGLLQDAQAQGPAFDVDVQGQSIIVRRCTCLSVFM
jgi:hypothetical protein